MAAGGGWLSWYVKTGVSIRISRLRVHVVARGRAKVEKLQSLLKIFERDIDDSDIVTMNKEETK